VLSIWYHCVPVNMMEMMADKDTMRMQLDMLFKMETYMNMKDVSGKFAH